MPEVGEESIQSLYNAVQGFYAQFEAAPAEALAEEKALAAETPVNAGDAPVTEAALAAAPVPDLVVEAAVSEMPAGDSAPEASPEKE
jgi:hypothetical protein